jgi:hypothetical protein
MVTASDFDHPAWILALALELQGCCVRAGLTFLHVEPRLVSGERQDSDEVVRVVACSNRVDWDLVRSGLDTRVAIPRHRVYPCCLHCEPDLAHLAVGLGNSWLEGCALLSDESDFSLDNIRMALMVCIPLLGRTTLGWTAVKGDSGNRPPASRRLAGNFRHADMSPGNQG